MYRQQFFSIRQNPYANTNQTQMREFITSQKIVTCPFGHLNKARNNVINGVYNEEQSRSQDRKFIENMNIGDIIVILFAGLRECILAKIVSDPIYGVDTGLFTSMCDGKIQVSAEGETPFRPVGRKIQIIRDDLIFADKRVFGQATLSCIKNQNILPN